MLIILSFPVKSYHLAYIFNTNEIKMVIQDITLLGILTDILKIEIAYYQ